MLPYSVPLNLSNYLTKEDDEIPWYAATECLSYVVERMRRSAEGYDYIRVGVKKITTVRHKKNYITCRIEAWWRKNIYTSLPIIRVGDII